MKKILCLFIVCMVVMAITPIKAQSSSYTLGTCAVCTGLVPDGTVQYKNVPTGVGTTFNVGDTVYFFTELKDINSNFRMGIKVYKEGIEIWEDFNSDWNDVGSGWKYSYYYPSQLNSVAGDYSAETYIDTGNGWQLLNTMNYSVGNAPVPTPTPTEKIVIPFLIEGWNNQLDVRNLQDNDTTITLKIYANSSVVFNQKYTLIAYEHKQIMINNLSLSEYNYGEIEFSNSNINAHMYYFSNNTLLGINLTEEMGNSILSPFDSNNTGLTTWKLLVVSNSEDMDETISLKYTTTGVNNTTILIPSHSNSWIPIPVQEEDIQIENLSGKKNLQTVSLSGDDQLGWLKFRKGIITP